MSLGCSELLVYTLVLYLLLLVEIANSRPIMQRLIINNHEWEVPNEPGWEEVLEEAEAVRERIYRTCTTAAECRMIVDELHAVFERHPVSKKYLDSHKDEIDYVISSIFKWG